MTGSSVGSIGKANLQRSPRRPQIKKRMWKIGKSIEIPISTSPTLQFHEATKGFMWFKARSINMHTRLVGIRKNVITGTRVLRVLPPPSIPGVMQRTNHIHWMATSQLQPLWAGRTPRHLASASKLPWPRLSGNVTGISAAIAVKLCCYVPV